MLDIQDFTAIAPVCSFAKPLPILRITLKGTFYLSPDILCCTQSMVRWISVMVIHLSRRARPPHRPSISESCPVLLVILFPLSHRPGSIRRFPSRGHWGDLKYLHISASKGAAGRAKVYPSEYEISSRSYCNITTQPPSIPAISGIVPYAIKYIDDEYISGVFLAWPTA